MNRVKGELSKVVFPDGTVFLQQPPTCPRKLPMQTTKCPSLSLPCEVFLLPPVAVPVQQFMWLNSKGTDRIPVIFMFCGGIFFQLCLPGKINNPSAG